MFLVWPGAAVGGGGGGFFLGGRGGPSPGGPCWALTEPPFAVDWLACCTVKFTRQSMSAVEEIEFTLHTHKENNYFAHNILISKYIIS